LLPVSYLSHTLPPATPPPRDTACGCVPARLRTGIVGFTDTTRLHALHLPLPATRRTTRRAVYTVFLCLLHAYLRRAPTSTPFVSAFDLPHCLLPYAHARTYHRTHRASAPVYLLLHRHTRRWCRGCERALHIPLPHYAFLPFLNSGIRAGGLPHYRLHLALPHTPACRLPRTILQAVLFLPAMTPLYTAHRTCTIPTHLRRVSSIVALHHHLPLPL